MKDYGAQNHNRKMTIISNMPESVRDILSQFIYESEIDFDNILYAGLVNSWNKLIGLRVIGLMLFHSFITQRLILAISVKPASYAEASLTGLFQTLLMIITIYLEAVYIFQVQKSYYLIIMDDEIALIPASKPSLFIRMPMEFLKEINIHLRGKIARNFSISVSDELVDLFPKDDNRFDILKKNFFVSSLRFNKTSGDLFNIQYAIINSQFKDKLRFNGKRK